MSESRLKEFLSHGPHDIEHNKELVKEIQSELKKTGQQISIKGPQPG